MGTSDFAIPALNQLFTHNFDIIGVVTQPDRPSGRGKRFSPSPVKTLAIKFDLQIYQPEKVRSKDFVCMLKQLQPDIIVVTAFGQLLPQTVLDIPPCGVVNIHPSLLPKYRGAAPIQWALINGEKETGVTLMLLDIGEDTGDIICMEKLHISDDDTSLSLHRKLAKLGAKRLVELLSTLHNGQPPQATPQNHNEATHAPRLTKETGNINWNQGAKTTHNLIRGTAGWPGASTIFRDGLQLRVLKALPHVSKLNIQNDSLQEIPGLIKVTSDRKLFVVTGEGELQILRVQPATKKVMDVSDFINGYQVKTGDYFGLATIHNKSIEIEK